MIIKSVFSDQKWRNRFSDRLRSSAWTHVLHASSGVRVSRNVRRWSAGLLVSNILWRRAHLFNIKLGLRWYTIWLLTVVTVPWKVCRVRRSLGFYLNLGISLEPLYLNKWRLTPDSIAKVWPIRDAWVIASASALPPRRYFSHWIELTFRPLYRLKAKVGDL
jgi:hypothetical protein